MRKIISLLIISLFAFSVYSTDVRVDSTQRLMDDKVFGQRVIELHSRSTGVHWDTLAAQDDNNVYGPYALGANGEPFPTTFIIFSEALTGTTPTVAMDYQIISSINIVDTLAGMWTSADTLGSILVHTETITPVGGKAIVFNLNNYDADGENQIIGFLRVVIPVAVTGHKELH